MSLAIVRSRAPLGLDAPPVTVEVHLGPGLPGLAIVGLPEAAVRESKDRVRSALINSGFDFPQRHITINLAPADLPKEGGRFDLPIALGILAASDLIPRAALEGREFLGELALSGELRPVTGVLSASLAATAAGRAVFVPAANATEAARPLAAEVYAGDHLLAVYAHLGGQQALPRVASGLATAATTAPPGPDLADVRGQHQARRALEIAAAGGHSLLFLGPPGTGKTLLAARLPGLLPPLDDQAALEVAAIRSLLGLRDDPCLQPPFRAPHHTASAVALVGGGNPPRPGEITLAHQGVLFLDELPEFDRRVLEVLREPLESGHVQLSRATRQVRYPARFQLVGAMNPCPCGYLGDGSARCHCSPDQVARYRARLSGPLLDRIDLHVEVPALPAEVLHRGRPGEATAVVRQRVLAARAVQLRRQGCINQDLTPGQVGDVAALAHDEALLLEQAMRRLRLSARAYHRVLRMARTIADLDESASVAAAHLQEALTYRVLDRLPA
ncbi:MAG: YifB family Mg chelatase-like AAA ATPase [Pseudomonadota bacterium]